MLSNSSSELPKDIAISCQNLGKKYHIYDTPKSRLKQALLQGRRKYYREFWALRNVSFEVRKGESYGLIGRNGSGKSTLLQLITGILNPSTGSVKTKGRVAALLELGSGFNPEFSGIENIYLNASLLGLSKEDTDERMEDIKAFADIGSFIDMPTKTYSSGMTVRLAFAIQAQINPDILIIDEALAVGDAKFQAKCYRRLEELREEGVSTFLVTHDGQATIRHCSQSILLENGEKIAQGEPKKVLYKYLQSITEEDESMNNDHLAEDPPTINTPESLRAKIDNNEGLFNTRPGYNKTEVRWGDDEQASIVDYILTSNGISYPPSVTSGSAVRLRIYAKLNPCIVEPVFGISIRTKDGLVLSETTSKLLGISYSLEETEETRIATVDYTFNCSLASGDYFISIGVNSIARNELIPHDRRWDSIHLRVISDRNFEGLFDSSIDIKASFD